MTESENRVNHRADTLFLKSLLVFDKEINMLPLAFFLISWIFLKQQIGSKLYTFICKQWTDCVLRRSISINDAYISGKLNGRVGHFSLKFGNLIWNIDKNSGEIWPKVQTLDVRCTKYRLTGLKFIKEIFYFFLLAATKRINSHVHVYNTYLVYIFHPWPLL